MARIRSIHPGLASDEAYMSMSMAAKAAWPVLWTECDDHGVFEWKPIVLKARIFPADNVDFGAILEEYERLGCVQRREVGGKWFGYVHNFCKFQRPKSPSYRFPIPNEVRMFVALFGSDDPVEPQDSDSSTPGLPQDSPGPTENHPQMDIGIGEGKGDVEEKKRPRVARESSSDDVGFEEFYRTYPRHEGRGQALKAYRGARKKCPASVLLEGAVRARERWQGADPKFIPHPATWLNGERWLDEPGNSPAPKSQKTDWDEFYRGVL